jgi:uncharacterized protein with FMN-binding domain
MVQALDRPALPVVGGVSAADTNSPTTTTIAPVATTATTLAPTGDASAAGGVPVATVAPSATMVAPAVTAAPATPAPAVCGALSGTGRAGQITERRNYGTVTVSAKFTADGTLCDASATYQVYDQKSVRYEEYSIPILNKQAIAAKSANIHGISGATAVSDGYKASLQSAIDNKH